MAAILSSPPCERTIGVRSLSLTIGETVTMTCYYVVISVTPDAARHTSYRSGHYLVDGSGHTEEHAMRLRETYNRHACEGVTYDLLACDDGMDCGMRTMADARRLDRSCYTP